MIELDREPEIFIDEYKKKLFDEAKEKAFSVICEAFNSKNSIAPLIGMVYCLRIATDLAAKLTAYEDKKETSRPSRFIPLTAAEIQSGTDRVRWAEGLIRQLPKDHEGRNSWLMNYGFSQEADLLRKVHGLEMCQETKAAIKREAKST